MHRDIKTEIKTSNGKKEVLIDLAEWHRLIAYVDDLKEANNALNRQIEEYNREFANNLQEGIKAFSRKKTGGS